MILDKLDAEINKDFYKDRFEESTEYCLRMIKATHKGNYTYPQDPLSTVAYLDVVTENCSNTIRSIKTANKLLTIAVALELIIIFILTKFCI